jgi:dienelactone hydrolase
VALTSHAKSPYKAAAQCHPAMVDPSEAPEITIPFCVLASKDESPEDIKKFDASLSVPKLVETYADQIHGWMGARSDLKVQRNKDEYERGYKTVLEFFAKYL